MPPTKKIRVAKKKSGTRKKVAPDQRHKLVTTYETVGSLKPYPTNPRKGNVDELTKSLVENGQYKPITVQKSTRFILAGNHTWLAARQLKMRTIAVNIIDVNDHDAKKIVIVDNKSSDDAEIDFVIMAALMESMDGDFEGTGYSQDEADAVMQFALEASDDAASALDLMGMSDGELDEDDVGAALDDGVGIGSDEDVGPESDDIEDRLEAAEEELSGAFQLGDDVAYLDKATGFWQIPRLLTNMLVESDDLPSKLAAWAGTATRDNEDPDQWWLYNYGADSLSGCQQPVNQVIISFYTQDEYFERWWGDPAKYVTKMLNSKMTMALMPDYSQWSEDPRAVSMNNIYRNFWLARFFQEAGIKVVPNISWRWRDGEYLDKFVLPCFPKKLPMVALQIQTFDHEQDEKELQELRAMYRHIMDVLKPESVLLYCGKAGRKFWQSAKTQVTTRFIEHRMSALAEKAKTRERKKTF